MEADKISHTIKEYTGFIDYPTLEALLEAAKDPNVTPLPIDVVGNDRPNHIIGSSLRNYMDGGMGADTLEGGQGNDFLWGGSGSDLLNGGSGDDHYVVDDINDVVVELGNDSSDSLGTLISYQLPENVERLYLYGSNISPGKIDDIDGVGNSLNNFISGTAGNNQLTGGSGDDTMFGGGGADVLDGGAGDDFIYVDSYDDVVIETADGGHDTVCLSFDETFDIGKLKNIEVINFTRTAGRDQNYYILDDKLSPKSRAMDIDDFSARDDTLCLSKSVYSKISGKGALKKEAFRIGTKADDADDRIIYNKKSGDVYYDKDGSGSGKAVKFASLDEHLRLTANDFLLV